MGTWPELHSGTNFNYVWDTNTLAWVPEESSEVSSSLSVIVDGSGVGQADVKSTVALTDDRGLIVRPIPRLTSSVGNSITGTGTLTFSCEGYSTAVVTISGWNGEATWAYGTNSVNNVQPIPFANYGNGLVPSLDLNGITSDGNYFFNVAGVNSLSIITSVWNGGTATVHAYFSTETPPLGSTLASQAGLWTVSLSPQSETLVPASGTASSSGNNLILTPTSGRKLRVYYAAYNPTAASVEAAFRFGTAGTMWLKNSVVANSVIAKEFGATRYIEGNVDQSLYLNLSSATSVNWNVFYTNISL